MQKKMSDEQKIKERRHRLLRPRLLFFRSDLSQKNFFRKAREFSKKLFRKKFDVFYKYNFL